MECVWSDAAFCLQHRSWNIWVSALVQCNDGLSWWQNQFLVTLWSGQCEYIGHVAYKPGVPCYYAIHLGFSCNIFNVSICLLRLDDVENKNCSGSIYYIQICIYSRIKSFIPTCISINLSCKVPPWTALLTDNIYQ